MGPEAFHKPFRGMRAFQRGRNSGGASVVAFRDGRYPHPDRMAQDPVRAGLEPSGMGLLAQSFNISSRLRWMSAGATTEWRPDGTGNSLAYVGLSGTFVGV